MPIKKDEEGNRRVEMEFLTPGTPEQVWQAMATGAGNGAWFTKTTIDEHVGGVIRFEFGPDVTSSGEITTWQPPHQFGYVERDWSPGAPPVATEITITSRSGDRCLVRMVHSLFSSSDEWDDQMEGFENGWPSFFAVLRIYLAHFAGRKAATLQAMSTVELDHLAAWQRLTQQLGLAGADAGERRTTAERPQALSGAIEQVQQDDRQRLVLMRLEAPSPGVALLGTYRAGATVNVSMTLYFYGDDAAELAASSEPKWRDWLNETFPAVKRTAADPAAVSG